MTLEEAIVILTRLREERYLHDGVSEPQEVVRALDFALAELEREAAHWRQQAEIARKGGHLPGSDF